MKLIHLVHKNGSEEFVDLEKVTRAVFERPNNGASDISESEITLFSQEQTVITVLKGKLAEDVLYILIYLSEKAQNRV